MPIKYNNRNNNPTVLAGTQRAIFGYGQMPSTVSMTNLVSNTGVVATDTTGVGTARSGLAAAGYGGDKAIFGYGTAGAMTNLVSNTGVVATDTTGVGTARYYLAAAGYGTDKAIFGYGAVAGPLSITNTVSNTGVVATDTTGVGTGRYQLAAAGYGGDKAIFGYGTAGAMTNLVSNTGVVATDTTGVGTARYNLAAAGYGTDKAIFGYGDSGTITAITNLVSNTGVVSTNTTGVGTARFSLAAAGYGTNKAIFGYGYTSTYVSMTNLVSNTGVVANDTTGVGTARYYLAAAGYSLNTIPAPGGMKFKNNNNSGTSVAPSYSVLFNGSNQYLSVARILDNSTDVTIEAWVRATSTPPVSSVYIVSQYVLSAANRTLFFVRPTLTVGIQIGSTSVDSAAAITLNTWNHLAFVRNGSGANNFSIYINGVRDGQMTYTGTFENTPTTIGGTNNLASTYFPGYISNLRILKGTALYTGASFTVPTSPLTAIANTALLTCQSPTIIDNSSNNFTITNNNSATVSSTSPFTASFTPAPNGIKFKKRFADPITYMIATGGDLITTSGSYKIHTFTTVGTSSFTISSIGNTTGVEYLVVGGGGGGGGITNGGTGGGGGGQVIYNTGSIISAGIHSIIVGDGGVGGPIDNYGGNGQPSYFSIYASAIGGGGGAPKNANGLTGANGGGGGENGSGGGSTVGGFSGASGGGASSYNGGGGGGAGANGSGRNGGNGVVNSILGTPMYYGGGGGGGEFSGISTGGLGGGGNNNSTGSTNTGGGGSGTQRGGVPLAGFKGGSGIVIIKYRYTA